MARGTEVGVALFGRDRRRSVAVAGVSLGLLLIVFLLETEALDAALLLVVPFVLVLGTGLAAVNAYWNDGLVPSWLVVFGPVFGWLWPVFVPPGPVFFDEAVVPVLWGVFGALVVGTSGYVAGRVADGAAGRSALDEQSAWLVELLAGSDPAGLVRWGLLAAGSFVVASSSVHLAGPYATLPVGGVSLVEVFTVVGVLAVSTPGGVLVAAAWIGLAAWPAYRNAGLLASWAVVIGPTFGGVVTHFVSSDISGVSPFLDATYAFLLAAALALVLGTGGGVFGIGLRRLVGSIENDHRERETGA